MLEREFVSAVPAATPSPPRQGTLDDMGVPLADTTFCVIDLETTGGSPDTCAITEVGAVKLKGGACLGRYQTLVDPGRAIPPEITVLTGITQSMVLRAPRIEAVLPSLLEFVGDAVIVGHNVRFDVGFLDAALVRDDRPRLANPRVDTVALARRLLGPDVPNCRLGTLAARLRLDHRPSHRALDDALATGDLLHVLIERATALGVTGLDDLMALPTMAGHAQAAKLPLTENLPREPGVYVFRDRQGTVLYVGKAANLRSRVRSYFSSDGRRKVGQLLRETARIDHRTCSSSLEAAVRELRMIHRHQPRFNRQGTTVSRYRYVKLTLGERFPRLSVVRDVHDDRGLYLGPVSSAAQARLVVDALHCASPIRRCTHRPTARLDRPVCTAAQLGASACPCSGTTPADEYAGIVERLVEGLTRRPDALLAPLELRMSELARADRFEEAADIRDRARALATVLTRRRRFDTWRRAGRVRLRKGTLLIELRDGHLARIGHADPSALDPPGEPSGQLSLTRSDVVVPSRDDADELLCVEAWLADNADALDLLSCDSPVAVPLPRLPTFAPPRDVPSRRTVRHTGNGDQLPRLGPGRVRAGRLGSSPPRSAGDGRDQRVELRRRGTRVDGRSRSLDAVGDVGGDA